MMFASNEAMYFFQNTQASDLECAVSSKFLAFLSTIKFAFVLNVFYWYPNK